MNSIRKHFLSKLLTLVAGLAFLNMSFFLAEVSFLDFKKGELLENIAKLIINTGFEEEREGESGEKNVKEIDPQIAQFQIHRTASFLISVNVNSIIIDHYLHANHALIFSPPPDQSLFRNV
jgi:hypothetical protein